MWFNIDAAQFQTDNSAVNSYREQGCAEYSTFLFFISFWNIENVILDGGVILLLFFNVLLRFLWFLIHSLKTVYKELSSPSLGSWPWNCWTASCCWGSRAFTSSGPRWRTNFLRGPPPLHLQWRTTPAEETRTPDVAHRQVNHRNGHYIRAKASWLSKIKTKYWLHVSCKVFCMLIVSYCEYCLNVKRTLS